MSGKVIRCMTIEEMLQIMASSPYCVRILRQQISYADAGSAFGYPFTVQNFGTRDDTYTISVTSDLQWADVTYFPITVSLSAKSEQTFIVPISIPANTPAATKGELHIQVASSHIEEGAEAYIKVNCHLTFTDVPYDEDYHSRYMNIMSMARRGFISGFPNSDGTFRFEPNRLVTRAEFAEVMARTYNVTKTFTAFVHVELVTPDKPSFVDVPKTNPFYRYIESATRAGFIDDCPHNEFRPNDYITRAEAIVMLALGIGYTCFRRENLPPIFMDVPNGSPYFGAVYEVAKHARRSLNVNYANPTLFNPDANITRGELCGLIRELSIIHAE